MTKSIKFYQVGGSVRDELMGIPSKDIDYAVECESYSAMVEAIKTKGTIYLERPEFLTVRANIPGLGSTDYVLCRKEGAYTDGRHPDKVEPGTIREDLARRDFTVNAIAKNVETGEIIDPFNGKADIVFKKLRCVGSAKERFTEDGLRMLRAFRFAVTKGFELDDTIYDCLTYPTFFKERLRGVSQERIREELTLCFKHSTFETLKMLDYFKALREYLFSGSELWLMPTTKK